MSCPECGAQTLPEQRFCRSCGVSVQMITRPLTDPTGTTPRRTPATILKPERRPANALTLWGFIVMFVGVAVGVIGKKLMHEDVVTVVGVLISLAGMFLMVYPYLWASDRKRGELDPSEPEVTTQTPPAKYLHPERNAQYASSITERTTDLFTNPATTTRKEKTSE